MKKFISIILILTVVLSLTLLICGCEKKVMCKNGCGKEANPECMAQMCDDCCDYWMGLNGCYAKH